MTRAGRDDAHGENSANGTGHPRRSLRIALAAASCMLPITACGSASKASGSAAESSQHAQGVSYSDCMRSHGVPDFPDPSPSGGYELSTSGINLQSPAYLSASRTCASLQPGNDTAKPVISETQQAEMVANARCIRRHGVPNSRIRHSRQAARASRSTSHPE